MIGFFDAAERSILEISIVLCTPIFIEKIQMKEWAEKKVKAEGERQGLRPLEGKKLKAQGSKLKVGGGRAFGLRPLEVRGWRQGRWARDDGRGAMDDGRGTMDEKKLSRAEAEKV